MNCIASCVAREWPVINAAISAPTPLFTRETCRTQHGQARALSPAQSKSEMVSSFSVHLTTPAYTGHSQQPFIEEFVLTQKFYARENCYQKGINFSSVMI